MKGCQVSLTEERSYLSQLGRYGVMLGLERIQGLLGLLGEPQKAFEAVLVAGTNGKGSTAAMIASILRASGRRVGLYTSPHLRDVRERFQVNGEIIGEDRLAGLIRNVRRHVSEGPAGKGPVTYFEFLTALAFLFFRQEQVELAVLEVGMGGRLDATNTVDPLVSVITSIDRDHAEHLGEDLLAIAREKAGILRPGKRAVVSNQRPEVSSFLAKIGREKGTDLWLEGRDFDSAVSSCTVEGSRLDFSCASWNGLALRFPLLGRHQGDNAASAVAACCRLGEAGVVVEEEAVRRGLQEVRWPGRLEIVSTEPLIVLDGAHNPAAVLALRGALEELFPRQEKRIIFGVLRDKQYPEMVAALEPLAKEMIFVRLRSERAADPTRVAREACRFRGKVVIRENMARALEYARQQASKEDVLCVTGSLYAVGEALEALEAIEHL